MFLHIITKYVQFYVSKNVDDSFNTEFTGNIIFCIFENILWVRKYLAYFVSCEKKYKFILISKLLLFTLLMLYLKYIF